MRWKRDPLRPGYWNATMKPRKGETWVLTVRKRLNGYDYIQYKNGRMVGMGWSGNFDTLEEAKEFATDSYRTKVTGERKYEILG